MTPKLMEKLTGAGKKHPDQIVKKDKHNFTRSQTLCVRPGAIQRRAPQGCQ